jgi:hypothetical protein
MAKVGNEAKLILSLAKEKVKNAHDDLDRELRYIAMKGNEQHPVRQSNEEALKYGYRLGIKVYQDNIDNVVRNIEER